VALIAPTSSVASDHAPATAKEPSSGRAAEQKTRPNATLVRQWNGKLPGVAPAGVSSIPDATALRRVWREWGLGAPRPDADFRSVVLVSIVVRATFVKCVGGRFDEAGDLQPQFVVTPDAPAFLSYAVCEFSRAGVHSVNGRPLAPVRPEERVPP
jgi:hypothetical protein